MGTSPSQTSSLTIYVLSLASPCLPPSPPSSYPSSPPTPPSLLSPPVPPTPPFFLPLHPSYASSVPVPPTPPFFLPLHPSYPSSVPVLHALILSHIHPLMHPISSYPLHCLLMLSLFHTAQAVQIMLPVAPQYLSSPPPATSNNAEVVQHRFPVLCSLFSVWKLLCTWPYFYAYLKVSSMPRSLALWHGAVVYFCRSSGRLEELL